MCFTLAVVVVVGFTLPGVLAVKVVVGRGLAMALVPQEQQIQVAAVVALTVNPVPTVVMAVPV